MFTRISVAPRRRNLILAIGLSLVMTASTLVSLPRSAFADLVDQSGPPAGEKPAVRIASPKPLQRTDNAGKAAVTSRATVRWPAAAVAELDLAAASGNGAGQLVAGTALVRADGMPVSVGRMTQAGRGTAAAAAAAPTRLRVEMLSRDNATRAGVDGVVVRVQRADGVTKPGAVALRVDYSAFREAYGGDWAGRLRLVRLPECALTTPSAAGCLAQPVPFVNDPKTATIQGDVTLAGITADSNGSVAKVGGGIVLALMSGDNSEGGSFGATGLSPSATWQAGGSTGDFTWSYPLTMPPSLGGPSPSIGMVYSSGTVDGRVSSANTQPSWIGEGFDYWPGFVERKYKDCQADGWLAYDNCWFTDNATISLNGRASELVRDDATGTWRLKSDDGSTVQRLTGADNGDKNQNGTTEGEYWKVTTSDGTQYFFGLHKLSAVPANAGVSGLPGAPDSNSLWTVPVVGNNPGEPCFNTHPSTSVCDQAWRWNLDYVVDTHGNALAYYYVKENNRYRSTTLGADREYTRGGYINRIEYGLRAGQTWTSTAAPAQVVFTAAERCIPGSGCVKPTDYPDVPFDQECLSGTCTKVSATFWTTKRLQKITTRVLRGGAYDDVDSWTFSHLFPATGDAIGTPVLWLSQIVHAGHLGATDVSLQPVVFDGAPMDNRVTATGNQVRKWRMTHIYNESGGAIVITYAPQQCTPTNLPASPQTNTLRCMPVWWTPPGGSEGLYWFHKYVVTQVNEQDLNGIGASTTEAYTFVGPAAWHYDEDSGLTPPERKTWAQWRGYGVVQRRAGTVADGQTLEETRFYRGMHHDRNDPLNPNSFRPESETDITDGLGGTVDDLNELAGQPREQITYTGDGGAVLNRSVSDGWVSTPTATATYTWGTVKAAFTNTTTTRVQSPTSTATRINKVVKTVNGSNGLVTMISDLGDETLTGDEECTRITYAPGTIKAVRSERYALNCVNVPALNPDGTLVTEVASADVVISDQRTYYDNAATWSPTPNIVAGDVTKIDELKSWTPTQRQYAVISTVEHDAYGRGVKQWDAGGKLTQTVYTPATGGPVTQMKTINPLGFETTTVLEVGNGAPLEQTDANGRKIVVEYDGLGRLVRSWLPGRTAGVDPPNSHVDNVVRTNGINYVTTRSIRPDGSYNLSVDLYDGLLRPIQTQVAAPGGGRTLTTTFYNSRGQVTKQHGAFFDPAAPTTTYQAFSDSSIPAMVRTTYDGNGRATDQIYVKYGVEQWRSKANFQGDRITSTPPPGGMPSQVLFDALGRATELKEFKTTDVSGAYTSTKYTFNAKSQQTQVQDSAGNIWTYTYDIRGRIIESTDPDQGKSRTVYDDAGEVVYTENNIDPVTGAGNKIYYEYDGGGRTIRTRSGSPTGTVLTETLYDTIEKGLPTSSTRYTNGSAYTTAITDYDTAYRPLGTSITLPPVEGALAGTYSFGVTYNPDGSPLQATLPAIGGLPAETVNYTYTSEGLPLTMSSGLGTYVNTAFYSPYGELTKLVLGSSPKRVNLNYSYEEGSRRLASSWITRDGLLGNVHKDVYTYSPVGELTKLVTTGSSQATDTQCFNFDEKRRLTRAFTPSSGDCATAPTHTNLGGPAPYWTDWTYDTAGSNNEMTVGNRTSQVKRYVGASGTDQTSAYSYNTPGAGKPHVLNQLTVTDASGTNSFSYAYDHAGNTTQRPGPSGASQQLFWNPDGTLEHVAQGGTTVASYIYDANGNRLLQKTPTGVTAYIGSHEVRLAGGNTNAVRYYSFGGQSVAVRDASGLKWLGNNSQGTVTVAIDAVTPANVDRRRYTPFGELRGTAPSWIGNQGFVGGQNDPTGLVHLGAREYDPAIGRFISVDPVVDQGNPQQMHGYAYANNNPVTFSDPSGLFLVADGGGGGGGSSSTSGGDGQVTLPPDLQALLDEANRVKRKSVLDIILEAGGEILKEVLGINDILNCFQRGDIVACISIVANIIPWAKIFKLPKIVKAIERAWSAVNAFWEKLKWAKRIVAQVDEYISLARKAAREAAERAAAAAKKAAEEAAAAAKRAKEIAEAAARKAAEKAKEVANKAKDLVTGCAKHSFAPETKVLLADGSTQRIDQLAVGDEVIATDPATGQTNAEPVTQLHLNLDTDLTDVTVSTGPAKPAVRSEGDGDGSIRGPTDAVIRTTSHHPFWDATTAAWVNAADLVPGISTLLGPDGGIRYVVAVDSHAGSRSMRDLTVGTTHTYYVLAHDAPVLVHNCSDPGRKIDSGSTPLSQATRDQRVIDNNRRNLYGAAQVGDKVFVAHSDEFGHAEEYLLRQVEAAGFKPTDIDAIYTEYGMCPRCQGPGRRAVLPLLRGDVAITYSIPFACPASRDAARVAFKGLIKSIFG